VQTRSGRESVHHQGPTASDGCLIGWQFGVFIR